MYTTKGLFKSVLGEGYNEFICFTISNSLWVQIFLEGKYPYQTDKLHLLQYVSNGPNKLLNRGAGPKIKIST